MFSEEFDKPFINIFQSDKISNVPPCFFFGDESESYFTPYDYELIECPFEILQIDDNSKMNSFNNKVKSDNKKKKKVNKIKNEISVGNRLKKEIINRQKELMNKKKKNSKNK